MGIYVKCFVVVVVVVVFLGILPFSSYLLIVPSHMR